MHTKFSIQNNNNRQTKKKPYKVRWCTLANAFCSRKKRSERAKKKKTRRHASNNVEVFIRGILNSAESSLHQIAAWMFTESIFKRFYWLFAVVVVVAVFVVIVSSGGVLESTYISEREREKKFWANKKKCHNQNLTEKKYNKRTEESKWIFMTVIVYFGFFSMHLQKSADTKIHWNFIRFFYYYHFSCVLILYVGWYGWSWIV